MSTHPPLSLTHLDALAGVPAYVVGRDCEGHWLALETHGHGGGIFRDEKAATHFAAFETDHRPGAVRLATETLSLAL